MLTSLAEAAPRERPAYRSFRVQVARVERLTPHFTRITFTADDLIDFGTAGLDQRVKVVLPLPEIGFAAFPDVDDWYAAWRELPEALRNPFRTYTVRAVPSMSASLSSTTKNGSMHATAMGMRCASFARAGSAAITATA